MSFVLKPYPASVQVSGTHVLDVVVRDDLSSMVKLRGFVHYGSEDID